MRQAQKHQESDLKDLWAAAVTATNVHQLSLQQRVH